MLNCSRFIDGHCYVEAATARLLAIEWPGSLLLLLPLLLLLLILPNAAKPQRAGDVKSVTDYYLKHNLLWNPSINCTSYKTYLRAFGANE